MQRGVRRWILLWTATAAIAGLDAAGLSAADPPGTPKITGEQLQRDRELQNARKIIERKLGSHQDGCFVVILTTTYVNYTTYGPELRPIPGTGKPSTSSAIHVFAGRPNAVEKILEHMMDAHPVNGGKPSAREWRLAGWFAKSEQANQLRQKLQELNHR